MNIEHLPQDDPSVPPRDNSCPVHILPFELLSLIFEYGNAKNLKTTKNLNKKAKQPVQAILSLVCRHWREVAILTPSLWTNIRLSTETAGPPYTFVSLFLERSKNLPIDIIVDEFSEDTDPETLYSDALILYALLVPHVQRWRSFDLCCAKSRHMSAFLCAASCPGTLPALQLESLRLQHHINVVEEYIYDPVLSMFNYQTIFRGSAPRLKHLTLDAIHLDWSQSFISAASNLTTLELIQHVEQVRPFWREFATILRGAPALQKLTLYHSSPFDHPDDWPALTAESSADDKALNPPIPLLHLTELVIGSQPEVIAVALLESLHLPSLTTLILDLGDGDYTDFIDALTDPATPLTPPSDDDDDDTSTEQPSLLAQLQRLAILNLRCDDTDLMFTMLEQLINLKDLRLSPHPYNTDPDLADEESDFTFDFLKYLIPGEIPDVNTVLPRLESLFLSSYTDDVRFLRELVQKRENAGVPLTALYVSWDEALTPEDSEWFWEHLETTWFTNEVYCWNTERAFEGDW